MLYVALTYKCFTKNISDDDNDDDDNDETGSQVVFAKKNVSLFIIYLCFLALHKTST